MTTPLNELDGLIARTLAGEREARGETGDTALHLIASGVQPRTPRPDLVAALVAAGADPSALNHKGQTPLDVATDDAARMALLAVGAKSAKQAVKPTPARKHR